MADSNTTGLIALPSREDDDELLTVRDAAAKLGVARSTFYTINWFRDRLIHVGARSVRVRRGDIRLYIYLRQGAAA